MKLPRKYAELSLSDRRLVRNEYARAQAGLCWFCGFSLTTAKSPYELNGTEVNWDRFPPNFLKYSIHLHHDHNTGMTLGAVHAYCNAVSFDYVESPPLRTRVLSPKPVQGKL